MNLNKTHKAPAFILMLLMLLNPLLAVANTLSSSLSSVFLTEGVAAAKKPSNSSVNQESESRLALAQPESCHEQATKAVPLSGSDIESFIESVTLGNVDHSSADCCEGPCMCAQSGCHAPIGVIGFSSTSVESTSEITRLISARYTNPNLSSLNPPPII